METQAKGRLARRVVRGAALLDEKAPGWDSAVNPDELRMASSCGCVLGQAYGDYYRGQARLFLGLSRTGSAIEHGFQIGEREPERDYDTLARLWGYLIRRRRGIEAQL